MIQELFTGGDTFEIRTVKDYPLGYNETTEAAKQELRQKAGPELSRAWTAWRSTALST